MTGEKQAAGKFPAARAGKKKNYAKVDKSIEQSLWDFANKLRGSVESSEHKYVVLSLLFLKCASDKFEHRREELIAEGKEKYLDMVDFYSMKNVFYLPEESRWSYVQQQSKQDDIALKVGTVLSTIKKYKALKGALPDYYVSRLGLDTVRLSSLTGSINDNDVVLLHADTSVSVVSEQNQEALGLSAMMAHCDYPGLRDDQLKCFGLDCAQGAHALKQARPGFVTSTFLQTNHRNLRHSRASAQMATH